MYISAALLFLFSTCCLFFHSTLLQWGETLVHTWMFYFVFKQSVPQASEYYRKKGDPASIHVLGLGKIWFSARCVHQLVDAALVCMLVQVFGASHFCFVCPHQVGAWSLHSLQVIVQA